MKSTSKPMIQRVDLRKLGLAEEREAGKVSKAAMFRWMVFPLTAILCIIQAIITVSASNLASQYPTSTLITVLGLGFLLILILVINPLVRVVFRGWVRPLGRVELMAIIAALTITAGLSTFGFSDALLPLIAAPWNSEWNTPQSGWADHLHPHLQQQLYITDPQAIRLFREGVGNQPLADASWGEWAAYYLSVARQVPWMIWLWPLGYWMIFILGCFGLFWSLSYGVLGAWARQEKLIFPLAKLTEAILPAADPRLDRQGLGGGWPVLFTRQFFWFGFLLSFGVLIFNAVALAGWLPMGALSLGMGRPDIDTMFRGLAFSGLVGSGTALVIFTCIAIAFLLPLEISFSVWFYFIASRVLIYGLVLQGQGQNFNDFPSDMIWVQNPVATLGMGGMLVFSSVVLWRVMAGAIKRSKAGTTDEKPPRSNWLPLVGLGVSFAVVSLWLCWNRLPLGWAIFVTAFVVLMTLGIMRIVAESGVFWIQSNASFFHFYKILGLGGVFSSVLVAPLVLVYATLFFDIKTFIAPNVLNAAKLRDDVGGSRWKFHLNVAMGVAISMAAAVGYSLVLAYSRGAQQMNSWFYSSGPKYYCQQAANAATMNFRVEPAGLAWLVGGGAWVALTFFLRRTIFWFPHPVGFLMNINPLMQYLWFSFFIGWLCKKLVLKYGGQLAYEPARQFMMGLVFGEIFVIFVVGAVNLLPLGLQITGIDLNRYTP